MENSVLQIRIDKELKDSASKLYSDIGLDISTAIRLFLSKSLITKGLPFDMVYDRNQRNNFLNKKEDLNVYMVNDESLYKDISVDEYIKESRNDNR